MSKTAQQEAWAVAVELNKLGIKPMPVSSGNWIMFEPPPPIDLLMRIMTLSDTQKDAVVRFMNAAIRNQQGTQE